VPGAPGPGASAADADGRAWTIAGGGYVATFAFVTTPAPFAGCLTCRSLTRFGDELLAGPGAPLVLPWMGRLSSTQFVIGGMTVDLDGVDGVTLDELGRPLHGLSVDADRWEVSVVDEVLHAVAHLPATAGFPVAIGVTVTATVAADGMRVRTTVASDGPDVVPVAVGWHPYLRASGRDIEVDLPFTTSCLLEDLLPTGADVAVDPATVVDPVFDAHWRAEPGMVACVRGDGLEVALRFGAGFGWAMTWVPRSGAGFVCVEPMAAPLDPFRPGAPTPLAAPDAPWVGDFTLG